MLEIDARGFGLARLSGLNPHSALLGGEFFRLGLFSASRLPEITNSIKDESILIRILRENSSLAE